MKQITEDYVSFEIAQLLKEKGFDVPTMYFFSADGNKIKFQQAHYIDDVARPTQSIALKWLREVHEIYIDVFIGSDESYDADGVMVDEWHFWTYYITNTSGDMIYDAYNKVDVVEYQTHEESVEAALLYVLKNLI